MQRSLYRTAAQLPKTVFRPFLLSQPAPCRTPSNVVEVLGLGDPARRALLTLAGGDVPAGASDYESFRALCAVYPRLAGHALYTEVRETLTRDLSVSLVPSEQTCDEIWHTCAAFLAQAEWRVYPVFCPHALFTPEKRAFSDTISALSAAYGTRIDSLSSFEETLFRAAEAFTAAGGTLADHGAESLTVFRKPDPYHANEVFRAALAGRGVSDADAALWRTQLSRILGRIYVRQNITCLLHTGEGTAQLLAYLAKEKALPKTVFDGTRLPFGELAEHLKNVQTPPSVAFFIGEDADILGALRRAAGQVPLGALMALPDVRAGFGAVARSDAFCRALCDLVAEWVENGTYPAADAPELVRAVCFQNAQRILT